MALVIPQHFAQVLHSFSLSGDPEPFAITYGVQVEDPPLATDATGLATSLSGLFISNVIPNVSSLITLIGTEVIYQGDPPPAPPVVGAVASTTAGGNTGATPLVPQNTAFLIHKRTSLGGRKGRGRCYLPGVAEGQVDNVGVVASATVGSFNTALAAWRTAIVSSSDFVGMVVLHDDASLTPLPAPTLVTSINMDTRVATQRRRLRR